MRPIFSMALAVAVAAGAATLGTAQAAPRAAPAIAAEGMLATPAAADQRAKWWYPRGSAYHGGGYRYRDRWRDGGGWRDTRWRNGHRHGYRYGYRYPYRHGYPHYGYYGYPGVALGLGFATGAIVGGAVAGGYGYGGYGGYSDYDAACSAKYRSYDPYSRTYMGYDGYRHPCRLP